MIRLRNAKGAPRLHSIYGIGRLKPGQSASHRKPAIAERLEPRRLLSGGDLDLWVSPNGTGNGSTQATPASLTSMLQTYLPAATRPTNGNVVVNLEDGTYAVSGNSFVITSQDGDSVGNHDVIFQNAPHAHPVISGGTAIAGWTPVAQGSATYKASIANLGLGLFRDLYVNGQRAQRARDPVSGWSDIVSWNGLSRIRRGNLNQAAPNTLPNGSSVTATILKSVDPNLAMQVASSTPAQGNAVEMVVEMGYSVSRLRIQTVQSSGSYWIVSFNSTDEFDAIQKYGLGAGFFSSHPQPFYLDNIPSDGVTSLMLPGEWYENLQAGYVYYCSLDGSPPTTAIVPNNLADPAAPAVSTTYPKLSEVSHPLLEIEGSNSQQPVQNVELTGLTFEYSAYNDTSTHGYVGLQVGLSTYSLGLGTRWTYLSQVPAVRLTNTSGVILDNNTFEHLGGAALEIYSGGNRDKINGNTFSDIGGDGIEVDGHQTDIPTDTSTISLYDQITNNVITHIGEDYIDSVGIQATWADGGTISHNDIHDIPDDGIAIGRSHNGNPPTTELISFNNVYNFKEILSDGGGIYLDGYNWNGSSGTTVYENYVHDSQRPASAGFGVPPFLLYLDHNAQGVWLESNVTYDTLATPNEGGDNHHDPGFTDYGFPMAGAPSATTNELTYATQSPSPGTIIRLNGPALYNENRMEAEDYDSSSGTSAIETPSDPLSNGVALTTLQSGESFTYSANAPELAGYEFSIDVRDNDPNYSDYVQLVIDGGATASTTFALTSTSGYFEQQRPGSIMMSPGPHTIQWTFYGPLSNFGFDSFSFGPVQSADAVDNIARSGWPNGSAMVVNSPNDGNVNGVVEFSSNNEQISLQVVVPYTGSYVLGLRTLTGASNAQFAYSVSDSQGVESSGTAAVPTSAGAFQQWYIGSPGKNQINLPVGPEYVATNTPIHLNAGLVGVTLTFKDPVKVKLDLDSIYLAPYRGVSSIG